MKSFLYAISLFFLVSTSVFSQTTPVEKVAEPSYESYYYYILGYQAALSHDWEVALKNYKNALELAPRSIYLRTQIGYALYYSGQASEAVALLEEILKESPDDMRTLLLAGEIYKSQRKIQEAIKTYKKIVKIDPGNNDAVFILGGLLYYNNDVDTAVTWHVNTDI